MTKTILKGIGNTIRIAIKLVLVVLLIAGSYVKLDKLFTHKGIDKAGLFHSLPENSLDIAVIGSSHSQYSFIPNFIHNDLGLYSYVLGTACQPMEVSVEMLKEVYKTQNPKLVIFEVYTALPLSKGCEGDSCYVLASYQVTGEQKQNILSYLPIEKSKQYLNEFINNHNNWRNIKGIEDLNTKDEVFTANGRYSFGYVDAYPKLPVANSWYPLQYDSDVDAELREKDKKALNDILQLCKEHGSELLLYKTAVDGISQKDQSILNKIWKWADENGVKHINFIELSPSIGFHMQTHTNSGHSYVNGAAIVTNYLSDFIRNNYLGIFNHKQNDDLDAMYRSRNFEFVYMSSLYEYNPIVYMDRLFKTKGIVLLRYCKYISNIDKKLVDKLVSLGVKEGFDENCYYAVYKDGKLLKDATTYLETEVDGHQVKIDTDRVYVDGVEVKTWTGSPMSITVYDDYMNEHFTKEIDTIRVWDYGYTYYNE